MPAAKIKFQEIGSGVYRMYRLRRTARRHELMESHVLPGHDSQTETYKPSKWPWDGQGYLVAAKI